MNQFHFNDEILQIIQNLMKHQIMRWLLDITLWCMDYETYNPMLADMYQLPARSNYKTCLVCWISKRPNLSETCMKFRYDGQPLLIHASFIIDSFIHNRILELILNFIIQKMFKINLLQFQKEQLIGFRVTKILFTAK